MNKIKFFYDVVKAMNNKEILMGTLSVQVHKDDDALFLLRNEFEKNFVTGQTKAKLSTELDYEGKMALHGSHLESKRTHSGEHHRQHVAFNHSHHAYPLAHRGIMGQLSKVAFALSVLTAIQTEEQEEKTLLSLSAKDLPEDIKTLVLEKVSQAGGCRRHGHHCFKEFVTVEQLDFVVNMVIDKRFEVEKVVINCAATQTDEQNISHALTLYTELSLSTKEG